MYTHAYTGEALHSHHTLHGEALCSPTLCTHKCTHHAFSMLLWLQNVMFTCVVVLNMLEYMMSMYMCY